MIRKLKNQIHPSVAAVLVVLVLAVVLGVWWRGLVYRPPSKPGGGPGGGPAPIKADINILGRKDVQVTTLAGDQEPGDADGLGYIARFDRPTGLALDAQGALYVADTGNNRIRKILPDGQTATLAGGEIGYADGPALQARFNAPCGVCAAPDGALYVADTGNHCIRKIWKGQVSTLFGKPTGSAAPKPGDPNAMSLPTGISFVTPTGAGEKPYLLVADAGDRCLRSLDLKGTAATKIPLPGPPTAAMIVPTPGRPPGQPMWLAAIPQSGILLLSAQTLKEIPIAGGQSIPGIKSPALRRPVALFPHGEGWLVADNDNAAVFHVRNGVAENLAGHCSSSGPMRGMRDGDGSHAAFSILGGVVSDSKKLVYVADTANNMIRRLTIPETIGH